MCGGFWLYGVFSFLIFFFKQKTAYEMRISDWSSDVCSSDLLEIVPAADLRDEVARARFVDAVQAVAPQVSGVPVTIVEAGRAVVIAFAQAMLLAFVAIVVLLLVVLRSPLDTLLVLAPLVLAALLTVAVGAVSGLPFNFANVIVLPLLLGLGVDSGIHYVLRAREQAGGAVASPVNSTPRAILLSALTTIASFGAPSLSPHPGTARSEEHTSELQSLMRL